MRTFFKTFLAALLALIIFSFIVIMLLVSMASSGKIEVKARTVLVLDLGQLYTEQVQDNPLSFISGGAKEVPGLYDLIRIIRHAKTDSDIEGILLQTNPNPNGFAASEEIRKALIDFKSSGKFIIAHGDAITQKTYSIANVASPLYLSPAGHLEWVGYSVDYVFLKGTLEKLEIEPQIFYAGKFKSATEPLRAEKMTEENKLQTTVWLNDIYTDLLIGSAAARKIDTATLRRLAVEGTIQNAQDAVNNKLIDGLKYDDEVKDEIKAKLKIDKFQRIEFMTINTYMGVVNYKKTGGEKIALIYAEGDIIDGKGEQGSIGSETYRTLVRKARLDKTIKAIVFRINSGGGSALASENIWRELEMAKKEKPVIVSFGDVAASGGYYIACAADSIFALPTTITGSIGVFGIVPNMEQFFKNKLGLTFDGVKTGPYADAMTITRPMNEQEKKLIQAEIDAIYALFKKRVAEGRGKDTAYVDSIAQGRVWTGLRALDIGLIDRFGGIEDAIRAAASKAKLTDYQVREFPEPTNFISRLFGDDATPMSKTQQIRQELGEDYFKLYQEMKRVKEMTNTAQTRLPFQFFIQ